MSERRFIEPTLALREDFRQVVAASVGRKALLDPTMAVGMDRWGHHATIERVDITGTTGQRIVTETTYTLGTDYHIWRYQDGEPLGERLAHSIRANTVNPAPSELQLVIDDISAALSCSKLEAYHTYIEVRLNTTSYQRAVDLLVSRLLDIDEQEKSGLYTVDAFELDSVVRKVSDNFGVFLR